MFSLPHLTYLTLQPDSEMRFPKQLQQTKAMVCSASVAQDTALSREFFSPAGTVAPAGKQLEGRDGSSAHTGFWSCGCVEIRVVSAELLASPFQELIVVFYHFSN